MVYHSVCRFELLPSYLRVHAMTPRRQLQVQNRLQQPHKKSMRASLTRHARDFD